ncbi:MAG TPA: dihydrolipoamide acetyltransferase family protein [Planctomycetota bacterium]|nr:dihydrolipoamide acetyltransferase family protein [Planctomycetota bacterium]
MPTNIPMPQMGESIFEGTITKWLKKEGDRVDRDEPLFEISTDKVDTEIPSPVGGVVAKIMFPVGSKVPINTVVAVVDEAGAVSAAKEEPAKAAPEARPAPQAAPAPRPQPVGAPQGENGGGERRVFSSPLVRRIARQEGVDLSQVQGTGWKGRVTKQDVMAHLGKAEDVPAAPEAPPARPPVQAAPAAPPRPAPAAPPVPAPAMPAPAAGGATRVVPMSTMRQKIAEHMVMSRRTSAHVTTMHEMDVTRLVSLREKEKGEYETVYGTKLTYTHFFAMGAVQALKEFPLLNASIDGTNIVYHNYINLGMAVALNEGLIVPVVKNAEEKSFLGLARAINDVADRAKAKKLTVNDIQGGTFTITNPGNFGAVAFTPIINQPQLAILGIGSIVKRPVVVDDAIAIRSMCTLCLSFDHRAIDGIDAERFMARLREILETWTIPIR